MTRNKSTRRKNVKAKTKAAMLRAGMKPKVAAKMAARAARKC